MQSTESTKSMSNAASSEDNTWLVLTNTQRVSQDIMFWQRISAVLFALLQHNSDNITETVTSAGFHVVGSPFYHFSGSLVGSQVILRQT